MTQTLEQQKELVLWPNAIACFVCRRSSRTGCLINWVTRPATSDTATGCPAAKAGPRLPICRRLTTHFWDRFVFIILLICRKTRTEAETEAETETETKLGLKLGPLERAKNPRVFFLHQGLSKYISQVSKKGWKSFDLAKAFVKKHSSIVPDVEMHLVGQMKLNSSNQKLIIILWTAKSSLSFSLT